jgi:cell wall-associated NlpC family hydrolase
MFWMRKKLFIVFAIIIQVYWVALSQEFEVTFDEETISAVSLPDIKHIDVLTHYDSLRLRIIDKAKEHIGVNYMYGRADKNGFDCSGYVQFVYSQLGYTLPRSSYEQFNASKQLKEHDAKPGDLVFFTTRGTRISHVGIYLGNNAFIHSPSRGKQVCIDSLESGFFKTHFAGFGTMLLEF